MPWLMRIPGGAPCHVRHPVSHIDLVPTLLDAMGVHRDASLPGQSLKPLVNGERPPAPVFFEWNPSGSLDKSGPNPGGTIRKPGPHTGNAVRTIVSPDGWKLSVHTEDNNQLYNLAHDPGETENLFDEPAHMDKARELARQIHAWQERVDDAVTVEI